MHVINHNITGNEKDRKQAGTIPTCFRSCLIENTGHACRVTTATARLQAGPTLGRDARSVLPYSYFRAMTGIIVAARSAGYSPETMPIMVEKIIANSGSHTGV